ncbi:MAG: hypothetical protein ACXVB9_09540 [Bdellovibrionota bacterium]
MDGKISSTSGKEIQVRFDIRVLTSQERKKLALKGLGLFWGLSLATLPLPPLHWVSVPGFFLFGIYWGLRKLREPEHFENLNFPCPECGKEVKLPPQVVKNPLAFVCPSCRYGLKLQY